MVGLFIKEQKSLKLIKENIVLLVLSGIALGFNRIFSFQAYKYKTVSNATLSYYVAPVFVLLPAIIYQNNFNMATITTKSWIFIILLGIVHTGFAYLLYFSSIKELKGQSIAILSYIDPISGVVVYYIFL